MESPRQLFEQELCQRIDEALYYVWDPMNLARDPAAREEYLEFVPELFQLLVGEVEAPVLLEFLVQTESDFLGLAPRPSHARRVADLLLDWKNVLAQKYGIPLPN